MSLYTLGTFVLITGMVGLITWLITRNKEIVTSEGYFLAGRGLGAGVIAGSLLLTNLSTEQLVGLNGLAYKDGLCVMAWEVIAAASLVMMALFFLPRYLRRGITTIPEFLAGRFNETTRAITSAIFIFAYAVILLPIILYTGAKGLSDMLDVQQLTGLASETATLWVTVWTIGIIGSIYAIFGGLRSVAVSDTLNGFGLLVGGLLITYFGLKAIDSESIFGALETLKTANPEKFDSLGGPESSVPWPTLFTGVLLLNMFYWTTNQQIIQRTLAASSLAEGQKGVLLAATFKILAPVILVLPGIIAYHLYSSEGLANDAAYGTLVKDVLPDSLVGFFAAVMVGAILSSFNSALNATATLFSLGVYAKYIRPGADDTQTVRSGRIFGTIIAIIAMTVAPFLAGQDAIFGYLQKMNGLYFIPIFSVVVIGIATRRVPAFAANLALLVGVAVIAYGYFVSEWLPSAANPGQGIHEFHFLGIVFAGLLLLMVLCGLIAPRSAGVASQSKEDAAGADALRPAPETGHPYQVPSGIEAKAVSKPTGSDRDDEFRPDTAVHQQHDMRPWPLAIPVGIVLFLIVLAIYVVFMF
jgi:SSS family solute:Na+ symporter